MAQPFAPLDTSSNTSFSQQMPGLQLAVDSTSLGLFKTCAWKYYLEIICGYRSRTESVHLTFGILLHGGCEQYHHARAGGEDHESALITTFAWAMKETWNRELSRPWLSDDPNKNRLTLARTLVWYLDKYQDDPLETVILANGKPAVELSFSFDSGFRSETTGEMILLCGHLDRLARMNGVPVIPDIKSSKSEIGPGFFKKFSPDNQFSLYTLAGRVAFGEPVRTLIVDGAQILVGGSRFERGLVHRDDATVAEWLTDTGHWLEAMEGCVVDNNWPMNDKSCSLYAGCQFQEVCSRSPAARKPWLDASFKKVTWDPLQRRGDI